MTAMQSIEEQILYLDDLLELAQQALALQYDALGETCG